MPRTADESISRFSIAYFVQPDFSTELRVMTKSRVWACAKTMKIKEADCRFRRADFSDEAFDSKVAAKGILAGTRRMTSGEFLYVGKVQTEQPWTITLMQSFQPIAGKHGWPPLTHDVVQCCDITCRETTRVYMQELGLFFALFHLLSALLLLYAMQLYTLTLTRSCAS